ncbi:MAG: Peptidoglycan hydrolase FlgJ [Pseudomonadota bacterium]|jgi:flagellar protein FlgJ
MSDLAPSTGYLDFGSLTALRGQAVQDERKALRKAAEQFEAHFLQETLKAMRQTIVKSELSETASADLYEDLMDKEVAQQMARRGGVGMANMLERQFTQRYAPPETSTEAALKARALPLNPAAQSLPVATPAPAALPLPRAAAGYALPLTGPALPLPGRPGAKP